MAIAPTDAEAETIARRGASWMIDSYTGNKDNVVATGADGPIDPSPGMNPIDRYIDKVMTEL